MHCLLHAANLPPEFWSFALIHSVKIKNMLPHKSTGHSPYLIYTGEHPTANNLRIFGCHVYICLPGDRQYKLDMHATTGIFLEYTATQNNIIYYDITTKIIKTATHVIFDEANITIQEKDWSPASIALIETSYREEVDLTNEAYTPPTPISQTHQLYP